MKDRLSKAARVVMGSALDLSPSRPAAVASLVTAAASILANDFGPDEAIRLMRSMVDEAASDWIVARAPDRASATRH